MGGAFLGENVTHNMGAFLSTNLTLNWGGGFLGENLTHNMGAFFSNIFYFLEKISDFPEGGATANAAPLAY